MGSGRTNKEIALYTAEVIAELEEYLHYLTRQGDPDDKRADKIDQWIESWTSYLKREKQYNPRSMPAFKRGSIIYADLGFNVGAEYGGVHYAVVLNKQDSRNNHLLHILPLTSVKETTNLDNLKYFQLYLGNEIHQSLVQKTMRVLNQVDKELDYLLKESINISEQLKENDRLLSNLIEIKDNLNTSSVAQVNVFFEQIQYLENELVRLTTKQKEIDDEHERTLKQKEYSDKLIEKIKKLKIGSIALLNQVTTISKMRILDPVNSNSVFSEVILSNNTLQKIDDALKNIL